MSSNEAWHLEKKITYGNLLTTTASVVAIIVWVFTLQGRLSIAEVMIMDIKARDAEISLEIKAGQAETSLEMKSNQNEIIRRLTVIEERQYEMIQRTVKK